MKRTLGLMGILVTAIALSSSGAENASERGQLSKKDYKFAVEALKGSLMEVQLGQLAQQQGSNQAVKDFGQRMVTDHGKASKDLETLLTNKGASLPPKMAVSEQHQVKALSKDKGEKFDKAYAKDMVSDHKKDIKEFQKAATECQDPDLKAFASKTLPVLQEHLGMAETMERTVGK